LLVYRRSLFTAYTTRLVGADDSQKFTALSPDNELLAVGTTNDRLSILLYPSLEVKASVDLEDELVDVNWGGEEGGEKGARWVSGWFCSLFGGIGGRGADFEGR
jgi:hypothetical protein